MSDFRPYRSDLTWLLVAQDPGGRVLVFDQRTGERWRVGSMAEVHQIAADRSAATGFRGLGDLVHSLAERLGLRRCAPCARRQVALNRLAPRVLRQKK